MISANSRYASSTLVVLSVKGASRQVIYPKAPGAYRFSYVSHIYAGNETIDGLAAAYYGDPTQWWKIGQANPEIISWRSVAPGTIIRIPQL